MSTDENDEVIHREELRDLVDIDQLRELLGRTTPRGERVARSYADSVANRKGFPDPLIVHPRLRLWRRRDVERWLDRNRPGWRGDA
ncbi:hypothetical protein [Frankia sp. CiP1_Cm_nod2]|uniref:hypothetical protein n=1 Tax=Frankia sp. CiP1_Cm_nod2 TaxID=2897161 RepID=UPI002024AC4C